MSKVHQLIADAASYVDGEELPGRSLAAIALLLQADLELKLEEREERRRGLAGEVARDLQKQLSTYWMTFGAVVATTDGRGFVIGGFADALGGNIIEVMKTWDATKTYRDAGWRIAFAFSNPSAKDCSNHVPASQEVPFCQYCGHVPEDAL